MSKFKTILILGLAVVLISIPAMAGKPYKNFWFQVQDEFGAMRTDFVSISVYDLNTTDLATIYASATGTAKTNPILLAATSNGTAFWYADASTFDILVTFSDQTVSFEDFSVYDHRVMCLDKALSLTQSFNKVTIASTEGTTLAIQAGQVAGYGINMTTASQTLTGSFYGLQMHLIGLTHGSQRVTGIRMNMPVSTGLYDAVLQVTGRQTKGEIIDIVTVQTLGEVMDVSFDTVTLAGAMTGINLDMSTNVTHGSQTMKGLVITMPSGSTSTGIEISADTATGIDCNSTTASSSTTTGSIHTDGGLGVAGKVFTGDHIYMTAGKHIYFRGSGDDYQSIWSISGGKLKIQTSGTGADDLIIDGTITQMDDITLQSGALIISDDTTEASATTDGAIQTDGGVGIAKKLFVGGTSNFAGLLTAAGGIDTVGATNDITLKNDATIVNTSADLLTITEPTITIAASTKVNLDGPVDISGAVVCDSAETTGLDLGGGYTTGILVDGTMATGIYINPTLTTDTTIRPIHIAYNYAGATDNTGVEVELFSIYSAITQTTSNDDEQLGDRGYIEGIRSDVHVDGYVDTGYAMYAKLYVDGASKATELYGLNIVSAHGANAITLDEPGQMAGIGILMSGTADVTCAGTGYGQVSGVYMAWKENNAMTVNTSGFYVATFASSNLDAAFRVNAVGTLVSAFRTETGLGAITNALEIVEAHTNAFALPREGIAPIEAHVADESSTGRIKITVGGTDRYLYYYD